MIILNKPQRIEQCHLFQCSGCPLKKNWGELKTPNMSPSGPENSPIYILGLSPSNTDDSLGRPFSGYSNFLKRILELSELPPPRYNYIVRTHSASGNKINWQSIESCRPSIIKDIEDVKPKVVVAVGTEVFKWLDEDAIQAWNKKPMPVKIGSHSTWAIGCLDFYKAFIQNARNIKEVKSEILASFRKAREVLDSNMAPIVHKAHELDKYVQHCFNLKMLKEAATDVDFEKLIIDVETSGLDLNKSKLLTIAITFHINNSAISQHKTLVFPIEHPQGNLSSESKKNMLEWLAEFIGKFHVVECHNSTFDISILSNHIHNIWDKIPFVGDTMVMSYVLDTTRGLHSLNTCTRIYLGIESFKEASGINVTNLINVPLLDVMKYNGRDGSATYLLSHKLSKKLTEQNLWNVYQFHCQRLKSLSFIMKKGVPLVPQKVEKHLKAAHSQLEMLWNLFMQDPRVKQWNVEHNGEFNPLSPNQVKALFVSLNLIEPGSSTDEKALGKLKDPLAVEVLEFRKHTKRAAFFEDLKKYGEMLYSHYTHIETTTARLSCRKPNLQNVETGEPREIIQAPRGHIIAAIDFKQLEASGIADVSKDKYFQDSLKNGLDIHAECTRELLALHKPLAKAIKNEKDFEEFRSVIKNAFVFPAFYLASAYSLAGFVGMPVKKMEKYLEQFWAKFKGVKQWQYNVLLEYSNNGCVIGPTGRRYSGIMSPNDLANWQIQGASSDVVVAAQERCVNAGYVPILNVHDELDFILERSSADSKIHDIVEIILEHPDVKSKIKAFSWLKTPLSVDVEIGLDWGHLKKIGNFKAHW